LFNYNMPPDYWLVEISGIPFGLMGDMLEGGGHPYRGMIYGMTGRYHICTPNLWQALDAFGIQDAEMIGYWRKDCPVRTDKPNVLATVYRKRGKALIALAHFNLRKEQQEAKVRLTKKPPTIDGQISEGEWDEAAKLTNFVVINSDRLAEQQTEVFVTYDERNLYIGFRCFHKHGQLKANAKNRDDAVWEDDAIQIFIQPVLGKPIYFQFIGNSIGVVADSKGRDLSWNGEWAYKAKVGDGFWECELAIPFATIGMKAPKEGEAIGFNACRDQQTPKQVYSSWSTTLGSFHDPSSFGKLVFTTKGQATRQERLIATKGETFGEILKVRLEIDWKALGIDKNRCQIYAPPIAFFQPPAIFSPDEPIPVEVGKGWLLILTER
ncbi:MAG: DUF6067 family protein, partial [Armatimonadetes bacterium]|nr:DUF6067 family protein [Armatimonadota bacterium]